MRTVCINPQLKPDLLLTDGHGRFVGVKLELYRHKTLILGMYTSNEAFDKQPVEKLICFFMKIDV